MTVKERILERLESEDRLYRDMAEELKLHVEHSELEYKYRAIADAFAVSASIVTEEFAKEGSIVDEIRALEWIGYSAFVGCCPVCAKFKKEGHADDCKLAAILRRLK